MSQNNPVSNSNQPKQAEGPSLEELTAILTDPAVLRGDHLPEAERKHFEECQRSIVEAAIWFRPKGS